MKFTTLLFGLCLGLIGLVLESVAIPPTSDLNANTNPLATEPQTCDAAVISACSSNSGADDIAKLPQKCNSLYSGIEDATNGLQNYIFEHVAQSYKYLLLATFFNSYQRNREGFYKLYKKLSDDSWDDAIDIIQYMSKRGLTAKIHEHNINKYSDDISVNVNGNEFQSLSVALEMQKKLALSAHNIHKSASIQNCHAKEKLKQADCLHYDAEVTSFMEEEFVHKHAKTVRSLSGHFNDLHNMMHRDDWSTGKLELELYMFDQYLKKTL